MAVLQVRMQLLRNTADIIAALRSPGRPSGLLWAAALLQSQNAFCSCSKYSAMAWQELQPMLSHIIPANILECLRGTPTKTSKLTPYGFISVHGIIISPTFS